MKWIAGSSRKLRQIAGLFPPLPQARATLLKSMLLRVTKALEQLDPLLQSPLWLKKKRKKSNFAGFAAWKPYPNTTELAGFMKVNDTPAAGR
jgi:hypothetical protein